VDGTGALIRPAEEADFARLREIEVLAGAAFAEVGMPDIAGHEPPSTRVLGHFARAGRAWVHLADGVAGAYLLATVVDGCAHVEQVSVDPALRGRGLGRALIDHLAGWARERGMPALTLTTFRDVPWNAPYYRRIGFAEVPAAGGLAALVAEEAGHGLDPATRVCMRREVTPS
jgi:GNAT superfamily N-acetyltransferase